MPCELDGEPVPLGVVLAAVILAAVILAARGLVPSPPGGTPSTGPSTPSVVGPATAGQLGDDLTVR